MTYKEIINMPYIDCSKRDKLDPTIKELIRRWVSLGSSEVAGEFTYVVFSLLKVFSDRFWMRALGIGCLICVILETYRKDHAVYEDEKEEENGPV